MLSKYEKALQRVENASERGFSFDGVTTIKNYFKEEEVETLEELNLRYKILKRLFIDMGFCEMCPVHISCDKLNRKCETMLEYYLREELKHEKRVENTKS